MSWLEPCRRLCVFGIDPDDFEQVSHFLRVRQPSMRRNKRVERVTRQGLRQRIGALGDAKALQKDPLRCDPPVQGAACAGGGGGGDEAGLVAPPVLLGYSQNPAVYAAGEPIIPNIPEFDGGESMWTINGALPAGLSLDPLTGVLNGVPTESIPNTIYVITATNAAGTASALVAPTVIASPNSTAVIPRYMGFRLKR